MSLISTVVGLFKPSQTNAANVFNTVANGIDKLAFSEQEKAIYNKDAADALAQFTKDTLGESTDRSRTRRQIALVIVFLYLVLGLCCIALAFVNIEKAKLLKDLISALSLDTAFIMILAFFFGGYYLNLIRGKK